MNRNLRNFIVVSVVSIMFAFVYTNVGYYAGETVLLFGVIAWNWNDWFVMFVTSVGVSGMVTLWLHHVLTQQKKKRRQHQGG